ncbi:MAG: TlpA family protein disulfide reductase [Sphingobacteriales bacterium]|jgi:thiol-disulfide isomerase/thioredoxin|nr:TlpA family protein disulfide reductase [Sphingobacteriales bacterium]
MRSNYFLLLLIVFVYGFQMNAFAKLKKPNTIISGSINLDDQYEAVLSFRERKNDNENSIYKPLSKDGKFVFKINLKNPEFLNFTIIPKARNKQLAINFPLYIKPGSKENLNLHYNDTAYLSVGKGSLSGNNKALILFSNFHFQNQKQLFFNMPAADSAAFYLSRIFDFVDNLLSKFNLKEQRVKSYLDAWALNDYIQNLMTVQRYYAKGTDKKLPGNAYQFSKSPVKIFNQPEALLLYDTFSSLKNYFEIIDTSDVSKNKKSDEYIRHSMDLVNQLFSNDAVKTMFCSKELQSYMRSARFSTEDDFENKLQQFKELTRVVPNIEIRQQLVEDFTNLRFTREGASMPDVIFKDAEGRYVPIADFRGKYIYIDMWASWCIPCIKEIPYLKELEKDYGSKNIVFLSISVDEDKGAWKKKMDELNLSGHQLEVGSSGFEKLMNMQGIPHFFLFNSEGKLMIYKAPRPGSVEIRKIFDSI